jgi:BioD-like phosphotransacetylase family protein
MPRPEVSSTSQKWFRERLGVSIFASLPKEKLLLSVSVRELPEGPGGEMLSGHDALDDPVETLIVGLAEERRVPIILTRYDALKSIRIIENFFGKTRFQQQKKVEQFVGLLDRRLNFDALGIG